MLSKFRFLSLILLLLLTPFALTSIYYVINFQSLAFGPNMPRQIPMIATPLNNALYLDGNTFYKVADGQNKLRIGANFNLETRVRPETYNITNFENSVIISRTSDRTLLDYYQLYLEEVIRQDIVQIMDKPVFKVKFNVKRYANDDAGLTLESKTAILANVWSTIKIARIQNQIYLYVNGKIEDSAVLHGTFEYSRDGTNYIGAFHQSKLFNPDSHTSGFFKGAIDYIKITDGNNSLGNWDFNCILRNSPTGSLDVQLYEGIIKFFDIISGGTSTFTNSRCDKPVVPTPTTTIPFRLLPSSTPTPTPTPYPTFPNRKPYFDAPGFIRNNASNSYVESKRSLYPYHAVFVAKDYDRSDTLDLKISLESIDPNVKNYLRIIPGRAASPCRASDPTPTPLPSWVKGEKTVTLCGTLPPAKSDYSPTFVKVNYEATDGKSDGIISGFYTIRISNR